MKLLKILNRILLAFFFLTIQLFSNTIYEDYLKAEELYNKKEYDKSENVIEKVLAAFPSYDEAELLLFKILYDKRKIQESEKVFQSLKNSKSKIKEDLFLYLIKTEQDSRLQEMYFLIEKNQKIDSVYSEYLFKKKKYGEIKNKLSEEYGKYLQKIEEAKLTADKKYFSAIKNIKLNNVSEGIKELNESISIYPENYLFFLKLGDIYSDNKNYFLGEQNYLKALELNENKEIYEKLFKLYYETKNYGKMYSVSKNILDSPNVNEILNEVSKNNINSNRRYLVVLKREENKLFVDKKHIGNDIKIGDTFTLGKESEKLTEKKTGETIAFIKENYCKVRVYDVFDNAAILLILEEYNNIKEQDEFIVY